MPALSDPTTWRKRYWSKGYLFVLSPTIVFQARVHQTSFDYPVAQIIYDTVTTGAYTDVQEGMTVLFGSSEGLDDLGRQRIRRAPDATNLFIGWSSVGVRDGEVWLADGAYITVLDDYRVWAKTPRILADGTHFKDYNLAPGTYPQKPPPVANAGVGYAGFVDGSNVITVTFTDESYAMADGASMSSRLWEVGDGTITVGTDTDATITATFPPGFRWVKLTVTDSYGHSAFQRVPVFAAETSGANAPVTNFTISRNLRPDGQTATITLKSVLPEGDYPDGTLVMYWEDEYYEDVRTYLAGPSGREHMKFIGWHQIDQRQISADAAGLNKSLGFTCIDVAGRLTELPGFPQTLERKAAASTWQQMKGADINKYTHYILHWHSTALELTPLFLSDGDGDSYPFPALESDGQTLYAQGNSRAQAISHRLTCDSRGQLRLRPDPLELDSGDRTGEIIVTLGDSDYSDIRFTRRRHPRVHWLDGAAIESNTSDASRASIIPRFSLAPGKAPGQGTNPQSRNYQLVQDQTELNIRTGHQYARLNSFFDPVQLTLVHGGDGGLEPALMEWIRLNQTVKNLRDHRFINQRLLLTEVNIVHDNESGTSTVDVTGEVETIGQPGITITPPDAGFPTVDSGYDYYPVIDWGDDALGAAVQEVADALGLTPALIGIALPWNNPVGFTSTFVADEVAYEDNNTGITGTVRHAAGIYSGGALKVYLVTTSGTTGRVYVNPDLLTDPADWTEDHSWTLAGTGFNNKIRIGVSESTDLVLVAWKAQDGIRYVRRWSGSWGSVGQIGGLIYSDTTHDDDDLGLTVDGTKQAVCAAVGNVQYQIYYADSNGSFSPVANAPLTNHAAPSRCIVKDGAGNIYLDAEEAIAASWENLNVGSSSYTPTANATGGDADISVPSAPKIINGTIQISGDLALERTVTLSEGKIADDLSCWLTFAVKKPSSSAIAVSLNVDWTITVHLADGTELSDSGTSALSWSAPSFNGSDYDTSATVFISTGLSLPAEFEIEWVTMTAEMLGFTITNITSIQLTLSGQHHLIAQSTRKLYRVANYYNGSAAWTDITPTGGKIPMHHEALACDKTNTATIAAIGTASDGTKYLMQSLNQGGTWNIGSEVQYNWLKIAGSLYLAGGLNLLDLSPDQLVTVYNRLGDWSTVIGAPGNMDGAIVLFGWVT